MNKCGAFGLGNCNDSFNIYHLVIFCGLPKGHVGDHVAVYGQGKVIWINDEKQDLEKDIDEADEML
jgi:hypothetical protein